MQRKILSIILLLTMGISSCNSYDSEPEADGGIQKYNSGEDSPKVIESTEITGFKCVFSLIAAALDEESELAGRVYELNAVIENDVAKCKIEWYSRSDSGEDREFTADASFMTKLQGIVSKYNFAQHNGYSSTVSGLPAMYGAKLDINYASGESIYAYDNQNQFLPFEAIVELVDLFNSAN